MQVRSAQHEIRARLANLGAIHHQPKVRWLDMLPAHFEAVVQGSLVADVMAFEAEPDAFFHFRVHVTHGVVLSCLVVPCFSPDELNRALARAGCNSAGSVRDRIDPFSRGHGMSFNAMRTSGLRDAMQ
jgi:hypothetical protein